MAADDDVFRATDEASVALLRGLRAKTINRSFIHCADVCSAVPEELVADLQPLPGTDVTEDGYNSVWYIYCPKRYKNTQGKPGGHRQRAVEPDGETCWHSETGPKPVKGVPGATFCNLSYGRKEEASGRRLKFNRMGWCMTEFDDTQGGGGGDHVLCRVHRSSSSLAKKKSKLSSSLSKRKAAGDHPEAPPTKLFHDEQVQVQQDTAAFFTSAHPAVPCYGYGPYENVDPMTMLGGEEKRGGQQPRVEPEYCGEFNFDEQMKMLVEQDPAAFTNAYPTTACSSYGPPQGVDPVTMVGGEQEHGVEQPRVEPKYGSEFNFDELLNIDEQVQQGPATAFTNAYPMMAACYGHGGPQDVDPAMFGDVEPKHGGDLGEFNFEELLKGFGDFLAEQGQQPCAELTEQTGGGIVVSGGLLYAC